MDASRQARPTVSSVRWWRLLRRPQPSQAQALRGRRRGGPPDPRGPRPLSPSKRTDPSVTRSVGYSGTPLPKKLGIKEGSRVALLNEPKKWGPLQPLPKGVDIKTQARGSFDVIVLFAGSMKELEKRFPAAMKSMEPHTGLWIAYPKKASKVDTDLDFAVVQKLGLDAGLVDNKSCAVDEVYSGLRFVYRLKDRPR
jgi:hypothetical protein